jgi:hypothetical protein
MRHKKPATPRPMGAPADVMKPEVRPHYIARALGETSPANSSGGLFAISARDFLRKPVPRYTADGSSIH